MPGRAFAVVPAAGLSTRMGQPKLLLAIDGQPLIARVLAAWKAGGVEQIAVVVRPDDEPLIATVREAGIEPVIPPVAPPDMKASLQFGLQHVQQQFKPDIRDVWLVAPADMPGLSPQIIKRLISESASRPGTILIPTLEGRRGHPVLVPWSDADKLGQLPADQGLNALIDASEPELLPCDRLTTGEAFADIDTPGDWDRFSTRK